MLQVVDMRVGTTWPHFGVRDSGGAEDRTAPLLAEGGCHLHGEYAAAIDTAAALKRAA